MRMAILSLLAVLFAMTEPAVARNPLQVCNTVAEICLRNAPNKLVNQECTKQVDACMNRAACDYAYYSCLELMEDDESMSEATCKAERRECRLGKRPR